MGIKDLKDVLDWSTLFLDKLVKWFKYKRVSSKVGNRYLQQKKRTKKDYCGELEHKFR